MRGVGPVAWFAGSSLRPRCLPCFRPRTGGPRPAGAASDSAVPCLAAKPPPLSAPGHPLRSAFRGAGRDGRRESRERWCQKDARKADAARAASCPRAARWCVRLSRLFMAERGRGIRRLARRGATSPPKGFLVESQVATTPPPGRRGHGRRRTSYDAPRAVSGGTRRLRAHDHQRGEPPDLAEHLRRAFARPLRAIVRGISAARHTLAGSADATSHSGSRMPTDGCPMLTSRSGTILAPRGTRRFRRALDYVGVQLYPGLFWPPDLLTETAGEATLEALTLVRDCFMPRAGLGARKELWITRTATRPNRSHHRGPPGRRVGDTVTLVRRYSGTARRERLPLLQPSDNRRRARTSSTTSESCEPTIHEARILGVPAPHPAVRARP